MLLLNATNGGHKSASKMQSEVKKGGINNKCHVMQKMKKDYAISLTVTINTEIIVVIFVKDIATTRVEIILKNAVTLSRKRCNEFGWNR